MKQTKLSPSSIGVYKSCPLCFWLEKIKNIKRPRGIFPSLPGGMDRIIKEYMDSYRSASNLPLELQCEDTAGLMLFQYQDDLNKWRNWRTGLTAEVGGVTLIGAIDDLLVDPNTHEAIVFDYKTKGSPATAEYAEKYYQHQMAIYALMLTPKFMPANYGIFSYWSPRQVLSQAGGYEIHNAVQFETQVIKINLDLSAATKLVTDAAKCLRGPQPEPSLDCEYCNLVRARR